MNARHHGCHVVLCSRSVVFSLLASLHFRLQAAKFSSSLSMVLNCGNFKGDVDNCGDLGYFILVIRVLNFRQSRRQNL